MAALIGCSGWSYDDWIERFYPASIGSKKSEWLAFYAKFFPTVEINSTFYRVPNSDIVKAWIEKGSKIGKFEFSVKMPEVVTHESIVNDSAEKAAAQASSFEAICIEPLANAGLLGSVLIQLSPRFVFDDEKSLNKLRALFEVVNHDKFSYATEFRHRTWLNEAGTDLKSDVLDLLREFKITNVIVDGPGFPITRSLTSNTAYVRFHGRNYDIWYKEERYPDVKTPPLCAHCGKPTSWTSDDRYYCHQCQKYVPKGQSKDEDDDFRINRYDYLYSDEQLNIWKPRIQELMENASQVRVYFNNHGRAKAVKNALFMMDLIGIQHEQKEIIIQDQMTLGEFTRDH
jgi:uncharacterized protein YecE (DUF72 family)